MQRGHAEDLHFCFTNVSPQNANRHSIGQSYGFGIKADSFEKDLIRFVA